MARDEVYSKLAEYEVGWWKAHHRRNETELTGQMAELYKLQFGISHDHAVEAVEYRVEATKEHDLAEMFEDEGNQQEADMHWDMAEKLLSEHFRILDERI